MPLSLPGPPTLPTSAVSRGAGIAATSLPPALNVHSRPPHNIVRAGMTKARGIGDIRAHGSRTWKTAEVG